MKWIRDTVFWKYAGITGVCLGLFFLWELGYLSSILPSLARPAPSQREILFAIVLIVLLALNAGLFAWQKKNGTCPIGAKRASGIAGVLGATALICPACILLPFTILGTSISLVFLSPFLPLLQIIAIFLLVVSTVMMWPKQ